MSRPEVAVFTANKDGADYSFQYVQYTQAVGSCHHGMVHHQVADGGMASNMEGCCEYIEKTVADSRQGVVLQFGGWARC
jgi:hypothetical protein